MAIRARCPHCQTDHNLADNLAGKKIRCKKCRGIVRVPAGNKVDSAPASSRARVFILLGVLLLLGLGAGGYVLFLGDPTGLTGPRIPKGPTDPEKVIHGKWQHDGEVKYAMIHTLEFAED